MGRSTSSRGDRSLSSGTTHRGKRRCCCHPCLLVLLAIVLIGAGGVLVWQLLPDEQKDAIKGVGGSVNDGQNLGTAPIFDYNRCSSTDDENCCNGVDGICDLPVTDVMFAGLHNAMSTAQDEFFIAANHQFQLESALTAGFRAINVDVGNCGGELVLVHTKCTLGTRDPFTVFDHINRFLDDNPRDVILMPLQINNDVDQTVDLYELYNVLQSVSGLTDRMYIHERDTTWPTMRQLIDNDTRIIMFIYNAGTNCSTGDCPPGFHPYFLYASETLYTFETVEGIADTESSCPYDRGAQGYRDFYAVNNFVSDPLPSKASSQVVNQEDFVQSHLAACQNIVGRNVSVVFIDFWELGNLVDVVQTHNQGLGT